MLGSLRADSKHLLLCFYFKTIGKYRGFSQEKLLWLFLNQFALNSVVLLRQHAKHHLHNAQSKVSSFLEKETAYCDANYIFQMLLVKTPDK